MIYDQVSTFCKNNSIDLATGGKVRRVKSVPSRFKDVIITSTIGHRDHLNSEAKYRTHLYFPLIDSMLVELKDRFSEKSINVVNGINALCPERDNFLQAESIQGFSSLVKANFSSISNEIQVLKPMLKDRGLKNIVDFYVELLPLKQAFPTVMFLLSIALTIPISSTTCERTFSKMKLIKTKTRNSMSDSRLSDLCVLAIERDFDVDFEKVIDSFSEKHSNCRILLK